MEIKEILAKHIEPINILPDGTMDPTKSHWRFGGTVYEVITDVGRWELQVDHGMWHEPCYDIWDESLMKVLEETRKLDLDYQAYLEKERA